MLDPLPYQTFKSSSSSSTGRCTIRTSVMRTGQDWVSQYLDCWYFKKMLGYQFLDQIWGLKTNSWYTKKNNLYTTCGFGTAISDPYPKSQQEWWFIDDSCLMMLLPWLEVSFLPHGSLSKPGNMWIGHKSLRWTRKRPQRRSRNDQHFMFQKKNVEITQEC